MSVTYCTVCKHEKISEDQVNGTRTPRWAFTSERTSVTQVQIIFKLFDILKVEFLVGSVCDQCFSLVDQIDSLEFQIQAMTKALKSRIDMATEESYYEDPSDDTASIVTSKRGRKRLAQVHPIGGQTLNHWESEDEEKPHLKANHHRQIKQKKIKTVQQPISEANRSLDIMALPLLEDENSGDNDPIDVNKFLANDGIRIKEERIYDEEDMSMRETEDELAPHTGEKTFWDLVADPKTMEKALDAENVDFNVTMAQTTRGQEQLVYEGFTYKKYSYQDKQERIIKWKCSNYYAKKGKCPSKIATTPDGLCVLVDSKIDHNHEPDQSAIKIIMFRDRVKEMAVNHPDMKAADILANVEMLMDNPGPLGLKDESLMRYVQRVRSKQSKGEMGFKKVTYNRKKGYRWGMTGSMGSDMSSPEKKMILGTSQDAQDFVVPQDFQQGFLDHVRNDESHESHLLEESNSCQESFPAKNVSNHLRDFLESQDSDRRNEATVESLVNSAFQN